MEGEDSSCLYSWGRCEFGELGLDESKAPGQNKQTSPVCVKKFPSATEQREGNDVESLPIITRVACGHFHSAVLAKGIVYSFGNDLSGQCGHARLQNEKEIRQPSLPAGFLAAAVACGRSHMMIAAQQGGIYTCGRVKRGVLGLGSLSCGDQVNLRSIPSLQRVAFTALACGEQHTLALTNDGRVWSWGKGDHGRLGHGNDTDLVTPVVIQSLVAYNVQKIACGHHHSMVTTPTGDLYTFGNNSCGQLGTGSNECLKYPTCLRFFERHNEYVSDIAGGAFHSLVVTRSGACYAWGNNARGQLGINHSLTSSAVFLPVRLLPSSQVVHVAAGANHSALIDTNGHLYTFGDGLYGQLGVDLTRSATPVRVDLGQRIVVDVACGSYHTLATTGTRDQLHETWIPVLPPEQRPLYTSPPRSFDSMNSSSSLNFLNGIFDIMPMCRGVRKPSHT